VLCGTSGCHRLCQREADNPALFQLYPAAQHGLTVMPVGGSCLHRHNQTSVITPCILLITKYRLSACFIIAIMNHFIRRFRPGFARTVRNARIYVIAFRYRYIAYLYLSDTGAQYCAIVSSMSDQSISRSI